MSYACLSGVHFYIISRTLRVQSAPMRLLLGIFFVMAFLSSTAQTPYAPGMSHWGQQAMLNQYRILPDSNSLNKKWSLNKYAGVSTGFMFSNGTQATILSAPIGIQLTRRLTNNVYAFAGASIAPSYLSYNRSFDPSFNKNYFGAHSSAFNQLGISSKAEMGLLYVNDQRTFSISGSIGVGRTSYPGYPYNNNSLPLQQPVAPFRH
jgi:hypothetical protein